MRLSGTSAGVTTKNTSRIFEIDSDAKEIVANFRCLRHRSTYPERAAELRICSDVKIFDPRRPILCEGSLSTKPGGPSNVGG